MTTFHPDQLNRATLQRQMLLQREPASVSDVVRRIVALQAQSPSAPYIALWNRIAGLDLDTVDQAFVDHTLVKASLMRITLHAVNAIDYPAFHAASTPLLRAARLNDRRYRRTGLTTEDADGALPRLLEFLETPRSKAEILDHLAREVSDEPRLWWASRRMPRWSMRQPDGRGPSTATPTTCERRHSIAHRPMTASDPLCAATSAGSARPQSLTSPSSVCSRCRLPGLLSMPCATSSSPTATIDGHELFDLPDAPDLPPLTRPAPPRLMAMWDSTLLAYRDRSRILPDEHRSHVIRRNGDVLPTVLVDGRVAGVWKSGPDGIEIGALEPIDPSSWEALDNEARLLLGKLADRDHNIVGRTGTWWPKLPISSTHTVET